MQLRFFLSLSGFLAASLVPSAMAGPVEFAIHDIASDQLGVAPIMDPNLVNAWGLISSDTSPLWIGANGSGMSLVYNGTTETKLGLEVSIPGDGSVTGVAFNGNGGFNSDVFLFGSEDGTVSGWRGALGTAAETLVVASSSNVYKGIAVGSVGGNPYAYLANFRNGTIDVLKGSAAAPDLTGKFTDPNLPAGFAPFNIMNLGGSLYVTYAVQDAAKHDDVAGVGNGIIDKFDLNGNLLGRLVTGGSLNSPWGLAIAPAGFGDLGGDLLVGNFGDGTLQAYDSMGSFVELVPGISGNPLGIDGLWGLRFGNGGNGGPPKSLFFTAGPDGERHGLFGVITATPEPATWLLAATALIPLLIRRRQSIRG